MIQVEHVTKYFGPVQALYDVTFQVDKNEIVGLLGNNGAGKTTLMRILTTYLPASSGVARLAGFDVMKDSLEVRKRIGYLPESIPLYPEMRVSEYLDYRAKLKGVDRKARPARIANSLDRCRVREVERRLLGTLSKGYRQRVGLADSLLADPPILILDEPTDGLDPGQKADTLGMLRELGRDHTIMLSSHMLAEVETIVSRVVILRQGNLGIAKKLSELETDAVIILEARGPASEIHAALKDIDGVTQVKMEPQSDGFTLFEMLTKDLRDLREDVAKKLLQKGWGLRRLDLRRRKLQDRWSEITGRGGEITAKAPAPVAPVTDSPADRHTAVTAGS
jgi:ABC-2 type transport system ATP-binding protein